jgi:hypothetical protein
MKDALEFLKILNGVFPVDEGKAKHRIEFVNDTLVVTLFQNDRFYSYDLEPTDYRKDIGDVLDQIVDIQNEENEKHGLSEKENE